MTALFARTSFVAVMCLACAACGGGSTDTAPTQSAASSGSGGPSSNSPPAISGTPPATVLPGQDYRFTPVVNDADGDAMTFSIANQPVWATFSPDNGSLTGTPTVADIGTTIGILISVTDGKATTTLAAFDLTVSASEPGSATLTWQAPIANSDGTALLDLAGYRIYASIENGQFSDPIDVPNPGLTSYVLDGLSPATWYFAVTAYDRAGNESDFSNTAVKTVQ